MFGRRSAQGYRECLDGILAKTLAYGTHTLMTEFILSKGKSLPDHAHPHEQIGYLVSGRLRLTIAEETREMAPGDSWCVPGNVRHEVYVIEDSKAIEIFSPRREEYLQYVNPCDIEA